MPGVTKEQIARAKEWDLLSYLQAYEPQELKKCGRNEYCTVSHDSLKISNGRWHWHSQGIGGRTALACPANAASGSGARPACRPDTGPVLRVQSIGDNLPIPHCFCRPRRRRIEHTASVPLPGGAKAGHFQRMSIVQVAADRAASDYHTRQPPVRFATDGKLMPCHRLMVPVVGGYKGVGVSQGNRDQPEHISAPPAPSPAAPPGEGGWQHPSWRFEAPPAGRALRSAQKAFPPPGPHGRPAAPARPGRRP